MDTKEDSTGHKDFNGQGKISFLASFPTTIPQKQACIFPTTIDQEGRLLFIPHILNSALPPHGKGLVQLGLNSLVLQPSGICHSSLDFKPWTISLPPMTSSSLVRTVTPAHQG